MHKTSTGAESQTSGRSYRHKFVFIFLPSSFIYVWKVKCLRDTGVPKGNAHFFVITTTPPRPLGAPLGLTTPEELPRTSGSHRQWGEGPAHGWNPAQSPVARQAYQEKSTAAWLHHSDAGQGTKRYWALTVCTTTMSKEWRGCCGHPEGTCSHQCMKTVLLQTICFTTTKKATAFLQLKPAWNVSWKLA